MRRAVKIFVLAGCACAIAAASAMAQSVPVTVDSKAVDLAKGDKGGYTASVGLTNLTTKPIAVTAKPAKTEPGCQLGLDPVLLPTSEHTDVTVKIPAACTVDEKKGISFAVSSTTPGVSLPLITAAPKPEATPKPEWHALRAFPIALAAALGLAWFAFFFWRSSRRRTKFSSPLKGLPDTWKFSDSWVTNITALGGLLVGLFGTSDVVKALTGKDAESSFALATVGAAAAAVLVGAAPVLLLATKTKVGGYFTAGGLLAASAITVAAAAGEIYVVWRSSTHLDLGGAEDLTWILALAIGILLGVYAVRSILAELDQGIPAPRRHLRTHVRAKAAVQALADEGVQTDDVETALMQIVPDYEQIDPVEAEDDLTRRRSALL